jgi:predicted negative regulator of RcsB-dependent stress response
MSASNSAKFRIVLLLISFLLLGFMLWKLQQANRRTQRSASYQIGLKVQEARA